MGKNLIEELKRIHSITYGELNENFSKKIDSILVEKNEPPVDETSELYDILEDAARKGGISQQKKGKYIYDRSVEALQISLKLLGYGLPKHGADGLYGPETAEAVAKFKRDFEGLNLTEGSAELRDTLSDLGYEEKGGQITSGGEITDGLSGIVSQILRDFKTKKPNVKVRITGGNDTFHKTLPYKSKHTEGKALDLILKPYNSDSSSAFLEILNKYKRGDSKFSYIDEYSKPTKYSTGGHFHLAYGGQSVSPTVSNMSSTSVESDVESGESISPEMLRKIIQLLKVSDIEDSDLKEFSGTTFYVKNITDTNFYKKLLEVLGAPVTDENLKLLYAWRQSEGKAGKYNPFNTTYNMPGATNFNKVGVKNYQSYEDGLVATIRTLRNGRYNCIVYGLVNNLGADKISSCPDFKTWGTGDLVRKVVINYNRGAEPRISSLA